MQPVSRRRVAYAYAIVAVDLNSFANKYTKVHHVVRSQYKPTR